MTPCVIAHRGASGYLPEHTLESKVLAHAMGVDFLEQDVVATRDGTLVVLHDVFLDHVTDVAEKFPELRREDGFHYVIDFDIEQVRQLNVFERRNPEGAGALFPERFPRKGPGLKVATLEDELQLIQGLNATTGRNVGVYPEIKDPAWHHAHGVDLASGLLKMLSDYEYAEPQARVYVQCFDKQELRRVRQELGCRLKLVQLLSANDAQSAQALEGIAEFADGVGLPYSELIVNAGTASKGALACNALPEAIRAAGLLCHPYTFRRDLLPAYAADLQTLLQFFYEEVGVDGVFCDHPDVAVGVRDAMRKAAQD